MDLIRNLDEKFKNIDSKIITKTELIRRNYDREDAKVKEQLQEDDYKNGINQHRDTMLKKILDQLNEQLKQVDNSKSRVQSLSEFKSKAEVIKSANLSFVRSLVQIYESILFRSKFESLFDFKQMLNYSEFIVAKRSFDVTAVKKKTSKSCIDGWFKLPSDLLLVVSSCYRQKTHKSYMTIINEKGEIIRHKVFNEYGNKTDLDMFRTPYGIAANQTNIIAYNRYELLIDIYNFELELTNSFKLDDKIDKYDIMLNNYEIVLYKMHEYNGISLSCFNYENSRFEQEHVYLDTSSFIDTPLHELRLTYYGIPVEDPDTPCLEFQHLNDELVYLYLTENKMRRTTLLIFDRVKYENLFRIVNLSTQFDLRVMIYNLEIGLVSYTGDKFMIYRIKPNKNYVCETVDKKGNPFKKTILAPFNKQILTKYYFFNDGGESRIEFHEY